MTGVACRRHFDSPKSCCYGAIVLRMLSIMSAACWCVAQYSYMYSHTSIYTYCSDARLTRPRLRNPAIAISPSGLNHDVQVSSPRRGKDPRQEGILCASQARNQEHRTALKRSIAKIRSTRVLFLFLNYTNNFRLLQF